MKFLEVDPEEERRPTVRPDEPLVRTEPKRATSELYPVPDFDAIFAEDRARQCRTW